MSRVQLASLGAGVAQNPAGAVAAGVPGTIYVHDTVTPVTLYADESSANTLSTNGTFVTDAFGRVPGWVDSLAAPSVDITIAPAPTVAVVFGGGGGGGAVASVFNRTGTVVAQTGDYTVAQITGAAPLASPAFTNPTATTPATGDNSTKLATTAFVVTAGAQFVHPASAPVYDTPENHGAKRDGKLVTGLTYTSASKTVTAPTGTGFAAGDVGKVFALRNPAGHRDTFVSTIASVTDATDVVLATDPVGANLATTMGLYGTDDTTAVAAAISSAVATAQSAGRNAAQVLLSEGVYVLNGATTKSLANLGNSQLPLPPIRPDLGDKFELEIVGVADGAAPIHWYATQPQLSGSTLFSTLGGQANDATWGFPSVIGSPTNVALNNNGFAAGYGGTGNIWSNLHLTIRKLRLIVPSNPTMTGMDLRGLGTASVDKVGIFPFETPIDMQGNQPTTGTVALYMPSINNNDLSEIGTLTVYGYPYGLGIADHCNWKSARFIYCNSAILIAGPNGSDAYTHGAKGGYTSIEGCIVGVDASVFKTLTANIPRFPFSIDMINFEVHSSFHVNDPNSYLTGEVVLSDINAPSALVVGGAKNLKIRNLFQPRGSVTAPTLPATTVALTNPFWRDAAVNLTGGTVTAIAVDGTATGLTSGTVIVPSGKSITLTYSAAPTWNWTLL